MRKQLGLHSMELQLVGPSILTRRHWFLKDSQRTQIRKKTANALDPLPRKYLTCFGATATFCNPREMGKLCKVADTMAPMAMSNFRTYEDSHHYWCIDCKRCERNLCKHCIHREKSDKILSFLGTTCKYAHNKSTN